MQWTTVGGHLLQVVIKTPMVLGHHGKTLSGFGVSLLDGNTSGVALWWYMLALLGILWAEGHKTWDMWRSIIGKWYSMGLGLMREMLAQLTVYASPIPEEGAVVLDGFIKDQTSWTLTCCVTHWAEL